MSPSLFNWLEALRWKNLLIVVATQYLMRYGVLEPAFTESAQPVALPPLQFFLLSIDTVLIALGGYVVNDLLDARADAINRSGRNLLAQTAGGWYLYVGVLLAGGVLAAYLAGFVGQPGLFMLYPLACLGLWAYSRWLKHMPLVGNVMVALFCAGVVGIVLFAEREAVCALWVEGEPASLQAIWVVAGFGWFAFLTTLLREIVKDAEDEPGDRLAGSRTIATAWGLRASKGWALVCVAVLLSSLLVACWMLWQFHFRWGSFFCAAFIGLPTVWLGILLTKAATTHDFHRISSLAKLLMVAGLVLTMFL